MKLQQLFLTFTFLVVCSIANAASDPKQVPEIKSTPFAKYISSEEAHEMLLEDQNILFIDVRDPIEVARTGHPAYLDAVVPLRIQTDQFDNELGEYALVNNPSFVESLMNVLDLKGKSKHDFIIVTCGSGYRSAEAVRRMAEAGFTNVWHIPDGYAGDDKPGLNTHNAWQLKGLPWSRELVVGSEWIKLTSE